VREFVETITLSRESYDKLKERAILGDEFAKARALAIRDAARDACPRLDGETDQEHWERCYEFGKTIQTVAVPVLR
jgi:hypothetical protein